jgi:hypothetical protein
MLIKLLSKPFLLSIQCPLIVSMEYTGLKNIYFDIFIYTYINMNINIYKFTKTLSR